MKMMDAEREARLKELYKDGKAKGLPDVAGPEKDGYKANKASREDQAREIKVEKLQIQEGKAPNWDEIVPKKDPSQLLKDAEAMAPIAGMPESDITAEGKAPATAIDSNGELKINDMPIWGHTELGKPLEKFKPDTVKQEAVAPNERSSMNVPINNERREMKNPVESKPSITPAVTKPALAAETAKAAVSAKKESPSGIDLGDDILKELQEEIKIEDDISMEIMGDLKGKYIDIHELNLESMDVLSRISMNVKSNKKAKKKTRPKI